MLKKEIAARMNNTVNIVPKQLNPYQNIVVAPPRKVMPNTVMNSREKLKTSPQPHPPVTAQDVRGSGSNRELLVEKQKSAANKSGGMSQMATTAPRNDDDYGYHSGGRITAEL